MFDEGILHRIESNLAHSRQIRTGYGALWFNTLMFLAVLGSVVLFLVTQYHTSKEVLQPMNIERKELAWNNPTIFRDRIEMNGEL